LAALASPPMEQARERMVRAAKAAVDIFLYALHLQRTSPHRSAARSCRIKAGPAAVRTLSGFRIRL